jgi:cation:H+ antiporter
LTILILIISLAAILAAAIVFANAVEMLGDRLGIAGGAVGSVLAAVGTALPETIIPVIAIVASLIATGSAAGEIGVGAIIGAPFLLTTLGMFVVGASALSFRRRRKNGADVKAEEDIVRRDMIYFLICFTLAGVAGIVSLPIYLKVALAFLLLAAYAVYVYQTMKTGGAKEEPPERLWLWPFRSAAPNWAVVAQLLATVALMALGAYYFVHAVEHMSESLGIPAGLLALVIAPLATELPEKFNSIYWLRDDKDSLAFGNMAGAMVFQSTIPVSLGLLFTPWRLNLLNLLAIILALISGTLLYALVKSGRTIRAHYLVGGGILYVAFLVAAIYSILVS